MKSLQESLFDSDLVSKDIGALSVITNALENYLSKKTTGTAWIQCLLGIVNDIKYNIDNGKRYHLGLDRALKMKDDELYVYIEVNDSWKRIFLLGKGLNDLYSKFPTLVMIGYSNGINNIYADIYSSQTLYYKEKVYNEKFQYYKVSKDEIKTFVKEILDNIEQVF